MFINEIKQIISLEMTKRRIKIRFFAPFFFFLIVLFRCYLESQVFASHPYFSYYVALHHILWYFTVILVIILLSHYILQVSVEKLLWLMYGGILTMIPIIIVMVRGKFLAADYLTGSFRDIILHIFTFYFTYEKNLPLTAEVIIIFIGMTVVGYLYRRSLLRGLLLGVAVYLTGNLLAISWIGTYSNERAIFIVESVLRNQPFMAVICVHSMSFVTFLTVHRAGLITGERRIWLFASLLAGAVGGLYMLVAVQTGWFEKPIDVIMTALPVCTTTLLVVVYHYRRVISLNPWFWIIGLTVLLFQWAVLGTIYLHIGVVKSLTVQEFWKIPLRPS